MKMIYLVFGLIFLSCCTVVFLFFRGKLAYDEKLPDKFKTYQSIDSSDVFSFGSSKMTLLLESTRPVQSLYLPDKQLVVYAVKGKTENLFYRINKAGHIIDSLQLNAKPEDLVLFKGYILDKKNNLFYNWSFDGNKQGLRTSSENEQLKWDSEKQQQKLKEILAATPDVYIDYLYESPEPIKQSDDEIPVIPSMKTFTVLTYFSKGNCFRFFTTLNLDNRFPYIYTQALLLNTVFKRVDTKARGNVVIIHTPDVKYQYYQKLGREVVQFSGGGGNAPGFKAELYPGNLYTAVAFKKDTLRLKEFMYLQPEWYRSEIKVDGRNIGALSKNKVQPIIYIDAYMHYSSPELNYALFSNNDNKLYIIK